MRLCRLPIRETIDKVCLSVFLATICLLIYRRFWQGKLLYLANIPVDTVVFELICNADSHDPYKCHALLAYGRWLDDQHQNWQAPGCMMHVYRDEDLVVCLKSRRLVFIGDSTVRQLYWATARKLGVLEESKDEHRDVSFHRHGVAVDFRWDPYLNSSKLMSEMTAAAQSHEGSTVATPTVIVIIGGGYWHARYLEKFYCLEQYRDTLDLISQSTNSLSLKDAGGLTNKYSFSPFDTSGLILLTPVPVPFYRRLSPERAHNITPEKVESMDLILRQQSAVGNVTVPWSFSLMTSQGTKSYQLDGLHFTDDVAARMVDVILNLRCNYVLRRARQQTYRQQTYPMDKTCCNSYDPPNWPQRIIMNASFRLLPIIFVLTSRESNRIPSLPSRRVTRAITVLALAMSYCYYADRTPLFNKTQKYYTDGEFISLCVVTLFLGVASIRRSMNGPLSRPSPSLSTENADQPIVSRQQTDEWKGWMQCVILIYHYTGASKVLRIYEIIRLLVASYVFLSGFGHTMYFYKKADYSLRRCAAVLIRLNMISCILPHVMATNYLFYYFAPLISFWYIVIHITMAIGRSRNNSGRFLLCKILLSATVVNVVIIRGGFFELISLWLEKTCKIRWDVVEWRFRLQLDSYVVYMGMLSGILYVRMTDEFHPNTFKNTCFRQSLPKFRLNCVAYIAATVSLYWWFARDASSKYSYNAWFPYVSGFPILAFVILRNCSRHMRNFHSSIFAWIGRHSLETFTLQYHIWLAADTKGVLSLGIFEHVAGDADGGRKIDFAVLTIVFLWVCWHVAAATQTLTNWIVDPRERREDLASEENANVDPDALPRDRSNADMRLGESQEEHSADRLSTAAIWSASCVKKMVAEDLRVRLGLILLMLWLLNMVSG